jgi:hypothetical protein
MTMGSLHSFGGTGLARGKLEVADFQRFHLKATTGIEPV